VLRDGRVLPKDCFHLSFSRGGGPGGQHANKTETRVDLRLDLGAAEAVLGAADVARIRTVLANRLDGEGRLWVVASEHRSQFQNLAAAMARLAGWIAMALVRQRRRIATAPTRGSKRRRVEQKRHRGDVKRGRQGGPGAD
jgi:ribosome-associated protein